MSTLTNNQEKVSLNVEASGPAVEIFLLDGRFRQVAHQVGTLTAEVPPGIYKLRYMAGGLTKEVHHMIEPGQGSVRISGPEMPFSTAAPLSQTRTTRELHRGNAAPLSREIHETVGQGSELFFFIRDLERSWQDNVAEGLSLHSLAGELLVDLALAGAHEPDQQWAGCTVAVDPGAYRLRLALDADTAIEQTIVASPNWQSQIFMLRRTYEPDLHRADLFNASILMARPGRGFDPEQEALHTTDLARQGLVNGRGVVTAKQLNDMLYGKFENPMLGIYGGHLLLMVPEPDWDLLAKVVRNLRYLLGERQHPDVEALALRLAAAGKDLATTAHFETPPMLRHSWRLLLEAGSTQPDLIPAGSLAAQIADRLWGEGAWLIWEQPDESQPLNDAPPLSQSLAQLDEILTQPQNIQTILASDELTDVEEGVLRALLQLSQQGGLVQQAGERGVTGSSAGGDIITGDDNQIGGVRIGNVGGDISGSIAGRDIRYGFESAPQSGQPAASPPDVRLSQTVGLPQASLQQVLAGLTGKIAQTAGDRGVVGSSAGGDIITGSGNRIGGVEIGDVHGNISGQIAGRDIVGSRDESETERVVTLDELRRQVEAALEQVPPARQAEAQDVAVFLTELFAEAQEANPRPTMLRRRGRNLIEAAQDLSDIDTSIPRLAGQIVAKILPS